MLRILAYHRVADLRDTPLVDSRSVSATPAVFARQMMHLARYYHVIGMARLLHAVEKGICLPKRAVLITFDDAYADFAETAWPVLKRFGLPATLFVPTAYPDHPELAFCWDRLYQAFQATAKAELRGTRFGPLPLGNSDEKRRALRVVQDHVPTVPDDEAMKLVDSICDQLVEKHVCYGSVLTWNELRQLAREGLTVFCYPNGNHNDAVISILRDEGIRLAFTTLSGPNKAPSTDPLRLRRIVITPRTSNAVFCVRLLAPGVYFDAWRHGTLKRSAIRGPSPHRASMV